MGAARARSKADLAVSSFCFVRFGSRAFVVPNSQRLFALLIDFNRLCSYFSVQYVLYLYDKPFLCLFWCFWLVPGLQCCPLEKHFIKMGSKEQKDSNFQFLQFCARNQDPSSRLSA